MHAVNRLIEYNISFWETKQKTDDIPGGFTMVNRSVAKRAKHAKPALRKEYWAKSGSSVLAVALGGPVSCLLVLP